MSNPFAPNTDVQTRSQEADNYAIGLTEPDDGSAPELVIAFERGRTSLAVFLSKADAEQFLGRMTEQMREMGWLS
jgi:hypothetical protein